MVLPDLRSRLAALPAAGLGAPGSELRLYPELRHEIFNEPEAEAIFGDVLDWLRKHTA